VPRGAGVGSAIGFLRAPFSFEANRSLFMKLSTFDGVRAAAFFEEMEDEASHFVRSCAGDAEILIEHRVYMRYSGQGWEIPVSLTPDQARVPDAAIFLALFEDDYARLFGRTVEGAEAEITLWSVNAFTRTAAPQPESAVALASALAPDGTRKLFDPALGRARDAAIHARNRFQPGDHVSGPAVITEEETTIVLPAVGYAVALADGCIDMRRTPAGREDKHG
jgi:N-methylhydantoinase A